MKWHFFFHAFIRRLYFSRVTVTGARHVPAAGPLLAVCLHRNGAVDGFVYRAALPGAAFMVKATLRRSLMGRLFFNGVEVARSEDGERGKNQEAIDECVSWLGRGGTLAVFPEGTSGLGPRHLPFKSGAARIALRHLESGQPLTMLPLGIHYECPWAFRSRVEVVIGPPMPLRLPDHFNSPGARLQEVKRRLTESLESVGLNVPDAGWQDLAVSGLWWLPVLYFTLTWLAVRCWYRLKKLAVVAWNGLFHSALRPDALTVHRAVLAAMNPSPHE